MPALEGKVAVVTGGDSGIGFAIAKRFVKEGAYVFITGRRSAELDKAVSAIGQNVASVQGDISRLDDLHHLYLEVAATKGKIDVIVANAGFFQVAMTPDVTQDLFDIVARGTYITVQNALPLLNDGASIILISSAVWAKGYPAESAYSATKAALRSYVRTWTTELKDRKIRANLISPGGVEPPMLNGHLPDAEEINATKERMIAVVSLGRVGRPEDVASAALFLASEESNDVTGIDLTVDGGISSV
jgi:NAD(P)-dependent dehydrogenase (short-subunit alcohol dehydrogenase family)